jgi:hypothetical protein
MADAVSRFGATQGCGRASRNEPVDRRLLVGGGLHELGAVLLSRPEG